MIEGAGTSNAELAVVVPSVNGLHDLEGCMAALDRERLQAALDVIVVDRCGPDVREQVQSRFPWVRLIAARHGTTIPAMRRLAFAAATAPRIAVIEDHVIVPDGWARAMIAALDDENGHERSIVGGTVTNLATRTLVDRAAFYCEYSHCLPPMHAGESTWLTGNNVAYPRDVLNDVSPHVPVDAWENELHDLLRSRGIRLVCRPEITVGHKMHYTAFEYARQRFLYSRAYAGARDRKASLFMRLVRGSGALALPPLLLTRIARRMHRSGATGAFVETMPLLLFFVGSWAVGEMVGSWFGPGKALARVR